MKPAAAFGALASLGSKQRAPDPDKLLAAMAYMANATPGVAARELAREITQETGFELSLDDAANALDSYRGPPRKDDLEWIAKGTSRSAALKILRAMRSLGHGDRGLSIAGAKVLADLAEAMNVPDDTPRPRLSSEARAQNYDLFPLVDTVSHWCGRPFGLHLRR